MVFIPSRTNGKKDMSGSSGPGGSLNSIRTAPAVTARTTRLTVTLPITLVNQLRDATYWTPQTTLAWVVEEALRAAIKKMETANKGPFPPRERELTAGRPRSTRRQNGPRIPTQQDPQTARPPESGQPARRTVRLPSPQAIRPPSPQTVGAVKPHAQI
ncbi:MAG: hypothetical protein U0412_14605 [Nitrospira sp.]